MTRLCSVLAHSQALKERRKNIVGPFTNQSISSFTSLCTWPICLNITSLYSHLLKKFFFVTVYDLQVFSLDEKGSSRVKSDICINIFVFLFVCFFAFGSCHCTLLHCLGTSFTSLELPRCTAPLHNGRPDFLVTCLALSCVGPVPVLCSQPLVCFVSQSQGSGSVILLCVLARQLVSSTTTYSYHSRQPPCFL